MEPKVFIGCVTYAKHEHALQPMFESIARQTFRNWEIRFLDTTQASMPGHDPYPQRIQIVIANRAPWVAAKASIAPYVPSRQGEAPKELIANAREQLRQRFLASDCTHLWFIDDDMVFPADALALLLSHQAPVAVGVYLNILPFKDGTTKPLPLGWIPDPADASRARQLLIVDVIPARVIPVVLSGFGCTLLRRAALDAIAIRYDAVTKTTEDTPFYLALEERGIPVLMDTRVKCAHLKFPLGDARNRLLDFASYKVAVRQR